MPLTELAANLHMHTPYSDGESYHAEIAEAAMRDCACPTSRGYAIWWPSWCR